jgi:putative phosphoribosyl transferase
MMANTLARSMHREINIPLGEQIALSGLLDVPPKAAGLILFVHGSGSSRFSPRNQFVAQRLVDDGFATLLMDLLTPTEESIDDMTRQLRFDVAMLADRVVKIIDWLQQSPTTKELAVGLFGASTGAAAALIAASRLAATHLAVSRRADRVGAVVSRGGRPDLAGAALAQVRAPTLLIVGAHDTQVLQLNRDALAQLPIEKELVVVPGATHLFEEPGALEQVASHAVRWFKQYL